MRGKKMLGLAMAGTMCFAFGAPISAGAAEQFTLSDLAKVAQYVSGKGELTPAELEEFDLNHEGGVTLSDLVLMAKMYNEDEATTAPPSTAPSEQPSATPAVTQVPSVQPTTEEQAKLLALAQVPGATESDIVSVHRGTEDHQEVYEIKLRHDRAEWDFDVLTSSPTIWKMEMERPIGTGEQPGPQTEQSVRELVMLKVPGSSDADFTSFKTDREDGVVVYEGELRKDGVKYDFEVVRDTGEIIKWSQEMYYRPEPMPVESAAPTNAPTTAPSGTATPAVATPAPTTAPITPERAQQIALERIPGAQTSNVVSCKTDRENGIDVYEIEIRYNGAEYDYDITMNGTVMKEAMERPVTPGLTGTPLTEQSAKDYILSLISDPSQATFTEFKSDREDGVPTFEGKVRRPGAEYEFEIVQSNGELIKWDMELLSVAASTPSAPPAVSTAAPRPTSVASAPSTVPGSISRDNAIEIALARVPGATTSNVVKCERDREDGVPVYEVEIRYRGAEYEITIDAGTGNIIDYDVDYDD